MSNKPSLNAHAECQEPQCITCECQLFYPESPSSQDQLLSSNCNVQLPIYCSNCQPKTHTGETLVEPYISALDSPSSIADGKPEQDLQKDFRLSAQERLDVSRGVPVYHIILDENSDRDFQTEFRLSAQERPGVSEKPLKKSEEELLNHHIIPDGKPHQDLQKNSRLSAQEKPGVSGKTPKKSDRLLRKKEEEKELREKKEEELREKHGAKKFHFHLTKLKKSELNHWARSVPCKNFKNHYSNNYVNELAMGCGSEPILNQLNSGELYNKNFISDFSEQFQELVRETVKVSKRRKALIKKKEDQLSDENMENIFSSADSMFRTRGSISKERFLKSKTNCNQKEAGHAAKFYFANNEFIVVNRENFDVYKEAVEKIKNCRVLLQTPTDYLNKLQQKRKNGLNYSLSLSQEKLGPHSSNMSSSSRLAELNYDKGSGIGQKKRKSSGNGFKIENPRLCPHSESMILDQPTYQDVLFKNFNGNGSDESHSHTEPNSPDSVVVDQSTHQDVLSKYSNKNGSDAGHSNNEPNSLNSIAIDQPTHQDVLLKNSNENSPDEIHSNTEPYSPNSVAIDQSTHQYVLSKHSNKNGPDLNTEPNSPNSVSSQDSSSSNSSSAVNFVLNSSFSDDESTDCTDVDMPDNDSVYFTHNDLSGYESVDSLDILFPDDESINSTHTDMSDDESLHSAHTDMPGDASLHSAHTDMPGDANIHSAHTDMPGDANIHSAHTDMPGDASIHSAHTDMPGHASINAQMDMSDDESVGFMDQTLRLTSNVSSSSMAHALNTNESLSLDSDRTCTQSTNLLTLPLSHHQSTFEQMSQESNRSSVDGVSQTIETQPLGQSSKGAAATQYSSSQETCPLFQNSLEVTETRMPQNVTKASNVQLNVSQDMIPPWDSSQELFKKNVANGFYNGTNSIYSDDSSSSIKETDDRVT